MGSQDGRDGSVTIHSNVELYASLLSDGATVAHVVERDRIAWLQVARGCVLANGNRLEAGDGLAIDSAQALEIHGRADAELLLFDMAT